MTWPTRDALGRIMTKLETIAGVTTTYDYAYDIAGRLTEVKENGAVVSSYTYDTNGNRLSHATPLDTFTGAYDAQDRLISYGANSYAYTANGELTTKVENGQVTWYNYDVLGNLLDATLPNGDLVEYVIDAKNRRVGKKVNGVMTQGFLYKDALNPIAELDATGAVVSRFVYGSKFNIPDYMIKSGVTYRIISDHLGSPRLVVDSATGAVVQTYNYDEFGTEIVFTDPTGLGRLPFGFAGGIYDAEIGLVRFGARDYDAQSGRWTSKDPIRFSGKDANLYGYSLNDPVNYFDILGLYGTNDCSYYDSRCNQSGGDYYCKVAPAACNWFPKPPDPDPDNDNDREGWHRCVRKCLQDCDRENSECNGDPPFPNPRTDDFTDSQHTGCHVKCYVECTYKNPY